MKDNNCIFCKLANGEIPTNAIYEDEDFKVILDASPATKGHALILPKEHFADMYEMDSELLGKAAKVAQKVIRYETDVLNCDGYNVLQNNKEAAGQTVFHFHMHLIPRYKEDDVNLGWKQGNLTEEVKAEILADETALIRFNLPDGSVREVPAKEGVEDTTAVVGTTLYKYPCELTAKQMMDRVKVQVVVAGEVIAEYDYSIADYAAVIIANAEGKYSAESIALVKAMLNYGAYAQKNFDYNAENLANAQLAENEKSLSSVTVDTFETSRASGMIVDGLGTFAGSSLVLKSETTLKVYFEPAEGVTAEDLTFTVDGEEVTATTSGKYLVISITDIKAQELDKVFAVKVTDESHEGTFNACVFAYCYSVLSDTTGRFSEELKDVVKALYLYNVAADAYF